MYNSFFGIFSYARPILTETKRAYVLLALTVAVIAGLGHFSSAAGAESSSTPSAPPDTTPYRRPAVPEELRLPASRPARGHRSVTRMSIQKRKDRHQIRRREKQHPVAMLRH